MHNTPGLLGFVVDGPCVRGRGLAPAGPQGSAYCVEEEREKEEIHL